WGRTRARTRERGAHCSRLTRLNPAAAAGGRTLRPRRRACRAAGLALRDGRQQPRRAQAAARRAPARLRTGPERRLPRPPRRRRGLERRARAAARTRRGRRGARRRGGGRRARCLHSRVHLLRAQLRPHPLAIARGLPMTPELERALQACASEPIHLSGAIQPHGYLVSSRLPDWTITNVSANVEELT